MIISQYEYNEIITFLITGLTMNETIANTYNIVWFVNFHNAVVWGVIGMLVGVLIAAQLIWPELDLGCNGLATVDCDATHECGYFCIWRQRIICHSYM